MDDPAVNTATLTLLLSDIESSTALWERDPAAMSRALRRHDEIAKGVVLAFGGRIVKERGEGDSLFCVFEHASDALRAAIELQLALGDEEWSTAEPIRIRIALHSGETEVREGDLFGPTVNRCARLRGIAHGGQILLSHATEQLVRDGMPSETELLDLGLHRLRDLSRAEWVFQAMHPGLDARFPPLRSLEAHPNNLPIQLTSFIGRTEDAVRALQLVRETRLVTMTGPGGSGKTRLGLHVAAEAIELFPDGVWFVDLVPVSDPDQVPRRIAAECGLARGSDLPVGDALRTHLSDKSALLLIDNCEHLASASAETIDGLLRASNHLKVLATSRHALGVSGEHLFPVAPLTVPKGEHNLAARLLSSDAGKLFLERARAVMPRFAITSRTAPAVAAICRAVDGMPLAIELAAARLKALGPAQILERLSDRFGLLKTTSTLETDRHRTLRATIDWSYDLLPEPEKRLFSSLAVFRGGWTLDAAEAVCSDRAIPRVEVLDSLQSLVDHSMVAVEAESPGAVRYRMLETLREYAFERARTREDWEELRERHFDWFLRFIEQAEPELSGKDQNLWFELLEADLENVRAAAEWALGRGDRCEDALHLTSKLHNFWVVRGHYADAIAWLDRALTRAPKAEPKLRAHCLNLAGVLKMMLGELETAVPLLNESLALRTSLGDRIGQAAVINNLGMIHQALENNGEALDSFKRSVSLLRGLDNRAALSYALLNAGGVCCELGMHDEARVHLDEALSLARELDDPSGICYSACNLAVVAMAQQRPEEASSLLTQSLTSGIECRDLKGLHEALLSSAELFLAKDKIGAAAFAYGASEALFKAIDSELTPLLRHRCGAIESALSVAEDAGEAQRSRGIGRSSPIDDAVPTLLEQLRLLTRQP